MLVSWSGSVSGALGRLVSGGARLHPWRAGAWAGQARRWGLGQVPSASEDLWIPAVATLEVPDAFAEPASYRGEPVAEEKKDDEQEDDKGAHLIPSPG